MASIKHLLEEKAMGRCGDPSFCPVFACQNYRKVRKRDLSLPDINHRPYKITDHFIEKMVALDRKLQAVFWQLCQCK